MATPLSADKLLKALRDEGLHVVEHRSWRTNNRNHKGPWGPVHGVMIHHTVTSGTQPSVDLCYDGHSALPGPLCHGVIAKDGSVHLVGNGRANHAGLGDDDVLRAVIAEAGTLPPDNEANTDGNRHFYGFECVNLGDGKDPWPAAQLLAIERAAAAVCRAHRWTQRSVIGHLEWQPGKIDPRGFTMGSMRSRIGKRLDSPAEGPVDPPPRPAYEPFPGAAFFRAGRSSPIVTAMGRRLVAEGCGRYAVGPGPAWSEADRSSYAAWQRKLGYTGSAADGVPGRGSWDRLKVPNV
ncbi:N-acetylmuramoyl-L-alanine amidase [Streptomyces sp. ADI96-02]|uniref:peptidoglycan-binding protein n=1 Tax=unclassified Streptomyces TaxID=2593676 RepID=UPI000F54E197|nr:peptidoglycan-binding protein [Streptomyces sp. ADI96-02]RPK64661.1 N-acetylmuramoyl-L-alanine amidase [Streptomyces sp. ADI96-02]